MSLQGLVLRVHTQIYERTDGLIGHRMIGVPTRLWKLVNDSNHGRYDGYQSKTSRRIPDVALTPAG